MSRRQINEAKQFCESLVPVLEEERARNGSYPDSLQNSWWRGKRVPALIELNYLYVKLDHGHGFRLQFENPYALFDNVIAFRSERKGWYEYDANFNKAGWKPNPPVGDK
ncbi:MAG TPA: hypothetical protein VFZ59_20985 [Verrucomicrobiae bacterium]|nr:hypothetical protein [Verrucomicrobiae bacterium]